MIAWWCQSFALITVAVGSSRPAAMQPVPSRPQTLFRFNTTVGDQRFHCMRIPSLLWVGGGDNNSHRLVALAEGRRFWGDGCVVPGVPTWTGGAVSLVMRYSDDAGVYYTNLPVLTRAHVPQSFAHSYRNHYGAHAFLSYDKVSV